MQAVAQEGQEAAAQAAPTLMGPQAPQAQPQAAVMEHQAHQAPRAQAAVALVRLVGSATQPMEAQILLRLPLFLATPAPMAQEVAVAALTLLRHREEHLAAVAARQWQQL